MTTMPRHLIRAVQFDVENGNVVIEYVMPASDIRAGLVQNHAIEIPATEDFVERLNALAKAAQRALRHALEVFHDAEPTPLPSDVDVDEQDEDDDDFSPWDNPTERQVP